MASDAGLTSKLLSQIGVDYPPIGLARVDKCPADVDVWVDAVPSACAFWRRAEHATFFAPASTHMNCPIGGMVMGFDLSDSEQDKLMELVSDMCSVEYLTELEVPSIPRFGSVTAGVIYGPLESFPVYPDLALIWTTPRQAMLVQEALMVQGQGDGFVKVLGRPACAAIPAAAMGGDGVVSLGCAGMRTFTEIPDDRLLLVIPGAKLDWLAEAGATTLAANVYMTDRYQEMKRSI